MSSSDIYDVTFFHLSPVVKEKTSTSPVCFWENKGSFYIPSQGKRKVKKLVLKVKLSHLLLQHSCTVVLNLKSMEINIKHLRIIYRLSWQRIPGFSYQRLFIPPIFVPPIDTRSYHIVYIRNSTDLEYLIEILDVEHGFGVISLRKGYHRRSSGE